MTVIVSRFNRKGRTALMLLLVTLSGIALAGAFGVFQSLTGGGRLVDLRVVVLGISCLGCVWGAANVVSALLAPGAVYLKDDRLFVGGVICRDVPVSAIRGFQTVAAPTSAFRDNMALVIECEDRTPIKIHSGLNSATLDNIRTALAGDAA